MHDLVTAQALLLERTCGCIFKSDYECGLAMAETEDQCAVTDAEFVEELTVRARVEERRVFYKELISVNGANHYS